MGRYYWFFAVMFVVANAQYANQRHKHGAYGWELISIPFILILLSASGVALIIIKRSLRKAIRLSETALAEPRHLRPVDDDDPWTYFGSYSDQEIRDASALLKAHRISHEVKFDEEFRKTPGGWSGPYCLWVHDEHVDAAQKLLVPLLNQK